MVVVYLSNRYIRVVDGDVSGGNIHAKSLYYSMDNRGCILNGTITDEEGFRDIIRNLWETNNIPKKNVYLVIDSNQFTTKVVDAPAMKPKQMMEYISREFTDVERISNPVYGYFPLSEGDKKKSKLKQFFAAVAPRELVRGYMESFAGLDITISGVESAVGVTMRLAKRLPQLKGSTCIIQFADDMSLINLLLVDGEYKYSSRNRMFSESGTPEFAAETARTVSTLLQFAKAQDLAQKIPQVYIAGLSEDELQIYKDSIGQIDAEMEADALQLEPVVKPGKADGGRQELTHFALTVGGLIKTDPKTSILSRVVKDPEKEAGRKKRRKMMIPLFALAAVMFLLVGIMGGRAMYYNVQLKELEEYNQRTDIVASCDEYDLLNEELQAASSLGNSMVSLKSSVLAYPRVDSETERVVASCASGLVTAEISSYDAKSGLLSFDAKAGNVDQINRFIELLNKQEIFATVDYTGYSQGSDDQWSVKVNCIMAARQEESDDTEADREG